jgi:surface protein
MAHMFDNASLFNQDIGDWNTGNAILMIYMFAHAHAFNQDISSWDVSNVTAMFGMFYNALSFDQDLGDWDMRNASPWWDNVLFGLDGMFENSDLSVENYDSTLIGWSKQELQRDMILGAEGLQYCHSHDARQYLIDEYNWRIFDDGMSEDCEFTSVEDSVNIPKVFILNQNYPNPFNSSTTIKYELPKRSNVHLAVYDRLGRLVTHLVNAGQEAGYYEVTFDASSLPSGVNVYRIQAGDYTESNKLLYLK